MAEASPSISAHRDLVQIHAGLLEHFARCVHGAYPHDGRIYACACAGNELRHRLHAKLLRLLSSHNDERGSAVVDAGRVCSGDGAVLFEGGLQLGKALGSHALTREFIDLELDDFLFDLHGNGDDFLIELAGLLGGFALLLAPRGELILHLAGDAVFLGNVLSGDAHVIIVERIPKAVLDHDVNKLAIVHSVAKARLGHRIGRSAHVLHAANDHHVRFACLNHRSSHVDDLQAGTAYVVDGECGNLHRNAGFHGRLAGRTLAEAGLQDVAHQHFIHILGLNARAADGFLDHDCAKLNSGRIRQRTAKFAQCRAARASQYDFLCHSFFSLK